MILFSITSLWSVLDSKLSLKFIELSVNLNIFLQFAFLRWAFVSKIEKFWYFEFFSCVSKFSHQKFSCFHTWKVSLLLSFFTIFFFFISHFPITDRKIAYKFIIFIRFLRNGAEKRKNELKNLFVQKRENYCDNSANFPTNFNIYPHFSQIRQIFLLYFLELLRFPWNISLEIENMCFTFEMKISTADDRADNFEWTENIHRENVFDFPTLS